MPDLRRHLPTALGTSAFWVLLFGAYLLFGQRRPAAQQIEILSPPTVESAVETSTETPTPAPLRVYVSGAVLSPGVYRLPPDSLVEDAIAEAGGGAADADLVAINLAHPLSDGEQIYVPAIGESPPPPLLSQPVDDSGFEASELPAQPAGPIDLNTASADELETLPGVGPKTAQAIIADRPYGSVDDLLRVKGIGEKTLEKLKPFIVVE